MKYLLTLSLAIALFFNAQAQQNLRTLDSVLTFLSSEQMFHGQVLIAENGKTIFSKAYGRKSNGEAYLTTTPIHIQSVAKGITAISILQLNAEGKLSLLDPIALYHPSIPYKGVNLRHILNHTSGMPRFFELIFKEWPHNRFLTVNDMVHLVAQYRPDPQGAPGAHENYNQTAYLLLPGVVEKVAGQEFSHYVKQHILEPSGMENTHFVTDVPGYKERIGAAHLDNLFAFMLGEGNMVSTAEDLFKFDRALAQEKILEAAIQELAYTPMVLASGEKGRYGFGGSLVGDKPGNRVFQHLGQGVESHVIFSRYIDTDDVLIVVHDRSVEYAVPVYKAIRNIWKKRPFELPQPRVEYKLSTNLINKYVGDYGGNGFMHITTEGGKLFIQPDGNPGKMEIVPSSDTTFYFRDQAVDWQIYLNEQGEVIGFGPLGQKEFMMKRFRQQN